MELILPNSNIYLLKISLTQTYILFYGFIHHSQQANHEINLYKHLNAIDSTRKSSEFFPILIFQNEIHNIYNLSKLCFKKNDMLPKNA